MSEPYLECAQDMPQRCQNMLGCAWNVSCTAWNNLEHIWICLEHVNILNIFEHDLEYFLIYLKHAKNMSSTLQELVWTSLEKG